MELSDWLGHGQAIATYYPSRQWRFANPFGTPTSNNCGERIDRALLLDRFVFRRTLGLTIYTFNRSLSSFLLLEEIHGFGIENP